MNEYDFYRAYIVNCVRDMWKQNKKLTDVTGEHCNSRRINICKKEIEELANDGEITTRTKNRLLDVLDGLYTMQLIIKNNK